MSLSASLAVEPRGSVEAVPGAPARRVGGERALRLVAGAWWIVAFAGQLLFAAYIVMFYLRNALAGHPEAWNDVIADGYVRGDTIGNLVLAAHLAVALAVVAGGTLQLVPCIRAR
ncbi:MAG TPA: hypothetical protein VFS55_08375, partial [Dokdonella sp.]|nr:hypothetical protein [Dokdonella sp.]